MLMVVVVRCCRWRCGCRCSGAEVWWGRRASALTTAVTVGFDLIEREREKERNIYIQIYRYTDTDTDTDTDTENHSFTPLGLSVLHSLWHFGAVFTSDWLSGCLSGWLAGWPHLAPLHHSTAVLLLEPQQRLQLNDNPSHFQL